MEMEMQIFADRIDFGGGYFLEFIVKDACTICIILLAEQDPSLIDTHNITIATTHQFRGLTEEDFLDAPEEIDSEFMNRTLKKSIEWAEIEVKEHKAAKKLAKELKDFLKSAMEHRA